MTVMVDSNILIFSNVAEMPEYPLAREKLLALIDQGYTFAVNTIIVSEMNYKLQKILNNEESHTRSIPEQKNSCIPDILNISLLTIPLWKEPLISAMPQKYG